MVDVSIRKEIRVVYLYRVPSRTNQTLQPLWSADNFERIKVLVEYISLSVVLITCQSLKFIRVKNILLLATISEGWDNQ